MVTKAALMMEFIDTLDQPQGRGSRPEKSSNYPRKRLTRGKNLMKDYFDDRPIFNEDATELLGLLPQQKIIVALRMLSYGAATDQCAEICRMGESTTLECMKIFCQQVEGLFGEEYLCAPTPVNLRRLLARGEQRGFPGMIGSIDCMHWE
ncbi:uncharacterized protein LOC141695948 [Apium graveolens]|uniref:uncharacterized protein LOC141695948 n=1 Tax=Apium graveolens TaxID=4045 RepID=UPI003D78B5EE